MTAYSKVTRHGQITLPASVRKELDIEEGDLVEIEVVDERAVLMPKKLGSGRLHRHSDKRYPRRRPLPRRKS